MATKMRRTLADFPYAIRSFMGYLEGTQKSAHTIKNYRLDLAAFQDFLSQQNADKPVKLEEIDRGDVERYRQFLLEKGFRTNTRRRKLLTVTQFLNYLAKRKKLSPELAHKIPAPHKVERVPYIVPLVQLVEAIKELGEETLLDLRNKALLWTLAETGCLVSEISGLRYDQWVRTSENSAFVALGGERERVVPVPVDLYLMVIELKKKSKESPWIFSGFNKFGSLGTPITPRGVEIIVKHYSQILKIEDLTPRTFRHSVILKWFEDGLPQNEIQTRLGLKTTYAFRSYEPLLKSKTETTSTSETTL